MRLLKTQGSDFAEWHPQLIDHRGEDYSILSHRWAQNANDEVLFADIEIVDDGGRQNLHGPRRTQYVYNTGFCQRSPRNKPGYDKLRGAARQALSDGYDFIWIDTCCIDKSSSAELSEAINSMWTWYEKSHVCYAYLSDVPGGPDGVNTSLDSPFATSQWWTRGWTLQELIAPLDVVFFTKTWDPIGEKKSLGDAIYAISGIGTDVLTHARRLESVSVAKRMSWVSARRTTRVEDLAYSLMGIFSVNMPLLYGEGERSFLRLQQEIMKDSDDESIFAWVEPLAKPEGLSGLLARHPSAFAKSSEIIYYKDFEDREPYVTSNRGLSITLHLSRAQDDTYAAALHCPVPHGGDGFLAIYLKRLGKDSQHYARVKCARLGSLEKRGALETIYVRQSHPTHELETVLPYHYFHLRRLITGSGPDIRYSLLRVKKSENNETTSLRAPMPTSHATQWIGKNQGSFRVVRGLGKLSVALLLGEILPTVNDKNANVEGGCLVIMLGSISNTQVGFDAHEMNSLSSFEEMEKIFKPKLASAHTWVELEHYHVKLEIEPQVDGSSQLFLTDFTISKVVRVSPLTIIGDAVAHRIDPFVPTLPTTKRDNIGGKKIWQRLGRSR